MSEIYQPAEDSFLLAKHVRARTKGIVLDIGTGSGIQAAAALEKAEKVYAIDLNPKAVSRVKKKYPAIECHESNLLEYFRKNKDKKKSIKFDLIIFNPPYLPDDARIKDIALDGGKCGYEIIERFLAGAEEFLKDEGKILMVFSSLTKREEVNKIVSRNLLSAELLEKKHLFFEDLYVYSIKKTELLKNLSTLGLYRISYLAKGKRGLVLTGKYDEKKGFSKKTIKVGIKTKLPESQAVGRIAIEGSWLKRVNEKGIGPRLLFSSDDYIVYEFAEGDLILDFIEKNNKKKIVEALKDVMQQMRKLDLLNVDKEEMHHPIKHIIVGKKIILIDFERCSFTQDPKNVTQFCQFLISSQLSDELMLKKIFISKEEVIELAKKYKHDQSDENFKKIIDLIR